MAKRFTDTEIWEKEWYMLLSPKHKCLVRFIYDRCDAVGVWAPNWIMATMFIGEKVGMEDLAQIDEGNQFEVLENGKVFIPDFCAFQYGELKPSCKPHVKYIRDLKKHKLFERVSKGYSKGINTLEEKEKDKEKEKEKEKDFEKSEKLLNHPQQNDPAPALKPNQAYNPAKALEKAVVKLRGSTPLQESILRALAAGEHPLRATKAQLLKALDQFEAERQSDLTLGVEIPASTNFETWFRNSFKQQLVKKGGVVRHLYSADDNYKNLPQNRRVNQAWANQNK